MTFSTVPLRRIACILNGGTPPSSDPVLWDGEVPFATPPDLNGLDGAALHRTARSISEAGRVHSGLAPRGSILLSTRAPIGHIARIESQPVAFNQGCRALVPRSGYEPRFLAYALVASREQMEARGLGTTFLELSGASLADIRVPLVPASVQRAIADYLDRETAQIDAFIAKNEELITLLTERRATLIDRCVFGLSEQDSPSLMRVPEFVEEHAALRDFVRRIPATWRVSRFKALLTRRDARNWDCNATMRSLKITGEVVTRSSQQNPDESSIPRYLLVEPNDLVVNPMWLVGGAIGVSTRSGAVSPDYRVFRPRTVLHPRFLHHLLRSRPYRAQYELLTRAETTFDRRVSQRDLDRLPIPVPPPDEQSRIARVIDGEVKRIDATIEVAVKGIELARERRAALISAAVTGKIDVGATA